MRRLVVAAVAGIALLGGIAVVVIVLATGSSGFITGPGTGPGDAEPGVARPLSGLTGLPPVPRAPDPLPPPLVVSPPRPMPPEGSWEAVSPVARPSAAGPVGAAVGRELNELKDKLSTCFDEDVQARHGQTGYTVVNDYAPLEDHGTTVLMLQIETGYGEARIVDAPVETRGGASDGLVACAQRILRGHVIPTSEAKAQARYRILFPLQP